MERLVYFAGDVALVDGLGIEECMEIQEPLKKLHDYELAEEQGLLLRLPCPIGTTVYVIEEEWEEMYNPDSRYYIVCSQSFDLYMVDIVGKEVFLTKEEAEQKLVEYKGD